MLTPFLISNVIAAMIWFYMFDPVLGFVNVILKSDRSLARILSSAIQIWRCQQSLSSVFGGTWAYTALLFYTGLAVDSRAPL